METLLISLPENATFELGGMKFKKIREYDAEIACTAIDQHVKDSGKTWNFPKSLIVTIIPK